MPRLFIFASTSLFFLFVLYTCSLLSYFYLFTISGLQTSISICVSFIFCLVLSKYLLKEGYIFDGIRVYLSFLSIFIICLLTFSFFIDTSYDGQAYHLGKVLALEKGWNPVWENVFDRADIVSQNKPFIQSYPSLNSIWVFNVYKVIGEVEAGKGISFFFIIISGIFLFLAINLVLQNQFLSSVFTFLSLINPVSLVQIFTFGLDTQLYSFLLILLGVSIMIYKKEYSFINHLNFVIIIIFVINNKLTSIFYLIIFLFFFLAYLLLLSLEENDFKVLKQFLAVSIFSIFSGFFIYGFQPYVINNHYYKDFFYPAFEFDFTQNKPSNYKDENQFTIFFKSLFFESNGEFRSPKDEAKYKMPFSFSDYEKTSFTYLGPKSGGFGVLFSGIVILLLLLSILFYFFMQRKTFLLFLFVGSVLIFSCLINPLNSVARYIPQLWFIIPLTLFFSWKFLLIVDKDRTFAQKQSPL